MMNLIVILTGKMTVAVCFLLACFAMIDTVLMMIDFYLLARYSQEHIIM